jgi:hypothetical protein
MALLPEIHVNFDQLTFERVYQIFLPLIPGFTLVGGLMFAHPHSTYAVAVALGMGRYSRVAVLLCSVYVVGLILYGFSVGVTGNCSVLLAMSIGKIWPPIRQNEGLSKSTIWRRVAAEFLGSLTPLPAGLSLPAIGGNDVEWQDFYNVLQDYVLRGIPVLHNELLLLFTYLQATSWALIYLYWRTAMRGHWSILVVSITTIIFSATLPFAVNFFYWQYDRLTPWDFTARLINEIKMREKSSVPSSQQVVK